MNSSKFKRLDKQTAELVEQGVLHDPIARLSRKDLLTIQFAKIINYFRNDTALEWGGDVGSEVSSHESDQTLEARIERGYQRFLEDVDAFGDPSLPKWLCKKLDALPWGTDNFRLRARPTLELGYPFEPYLTCNGAILTCNQASRILSIKQMDLVRLKCSVLLDSKVVDLAIKQMLEPRPLWPRIRLKPGGKGRTYRFDSK
jgi:hypothetical protein